MPELEAPEDTGPVLEVLEDTDLEREAVLEVVLEVLPEELEDMVQVLEALEVLEDTVRVLEVPELVV